MSNRKISINMGPPFGFLGSVFLILLVLKLTGLATLSWLWVFAPLMIGPIIVLLVLGCFGLAFAFAAIWDAVVSYRRRKERMRSKK